MKVAVQIYTEFRHKHGLPAYETLGAAGMDIRSNISVVINPKQTLLIPTGIFVAIPDGYEIQIRPRSGLSLKTKLRVANSPGTVDSDYRGEVCIVAENTHGSEDIIISCGERIAQMVLQEVPKIVWKVVEDCVCLTSTARGAGGFNSTGVK